MLFPLTGTIHQALPALPSELVDHSARYRVEEVTAHLPAALTEQMHFECRLGSSGRVDLLVRVDHSGAEQVHASGGAAIFASRSWVGISSLCRRWQRDVRLAAAVTALWFEFDLKPDQPAGWMPTPRLFIELQSSWNAPAAEIVALFDSVFCLLGMPPPGCVLNAALGALPHSSRLLAVGCDPASLPALPRLCSWHPNREELCGFVGRLNGADESDRVEHTLATLSSPAVPLVAHVDGRERMAPGVGVELTFERPPQLRGDLREGPWLKRLVAAGLCPLNKAAALVRWPGTSMAQLCHQLWPVVLVRRINHVKLRIEEGLAVEAKAYLSLHHRFHRKGLLEASRQLPLGEAESPAVQSHHHWDPATN